MFSSVLALFWFVFVDFGQILSFSDKIIHDINCTVEAVVQCDVPDIKIY